LFKIIKNLFQSKENFVVEKDKQTEQKVILEELIRQGEKEANRHNFDESLKCFDKAISIDPTYDYSYGDKALILSKIGKIDESLLFFSKALELNPKNSITWYNTGLTYFSLKKLDDAIKCFDKAIENNENYANAWYSKGRCYDLQGNAEKAQFCLNQAKKIDPLLFTRIKKVPIK
jgi:tetratricopeptide (TPR) repeat protein